MRNLLVVRNGILVTILAASTAWAQEQAPQNQSQADPNQAQQAPPVQSQQAPPAQVPPAQVNAPAPSNDGWRRLGAPGTAQSLPQGQQPYPAQAYPQPGYPQQGYPVQGYPQQGNPAQGNYQPPPPPPPIPAQLSMQPGTFVTIRIGQALSTDHAKVGDAFAATLVKPVVVDGVVIAERGQTIEGRVSQSVKAGRVSGTSQLGVELTELTLVDGQQVPVHTTLINKAGGTTYGRDAGAIGTTTAVGAIAGAAAGSGEAAGIGAGAGAAVGVIGVLLTRGRPSVIYPETVLTFRIENASTIATAHAPQAFRYAGPGDYDQPPARYATGGPRPAYGSGYAYGPGYPYYGYGYPYYGYGYPYYGYPGVGVGIRLGGRWR